MVIKRGIGIFLLLWLLLILPVAAAETEYLFDSRSPVNGLGASRIPFSRELTGDLTVRASGSQNGATLEIRALNGEVVFNTALEGVVASIVRIRRPDSEKTDVAIVAAGGAQGSMMDIKIIGVAEGENKLGLLLQSKELTENMFLKRYPYFGVKGNMLFVEYYVPRLNAQGAESGDYSRQRANIVYARGKYEPERPVTL